MWTLEIYNTDNWFFSTRETAEKAVKLFKLKEGEYGISETNTLDDSELFRRINTLTKEERKELDL